MKNFKVSLTRLLCMLMLATIVLSACEPKNSGTDSGSSHPDGEQNQASNGETVDGKPEDSASASDDTGSEKTVSVETVVLNFNNLSLEKGRTAGLTVSLMPSNATDKSVAWTTSDGTVATVSDGTVTAVGAGTAVITATASNGKSASCEVTVTVPSTGIALDRENLQILESETATLAVSFYPNDATDKNIVWKTSDRTVATVSDGTVTAVGAGTAVITATDNNGHSATCSVTVTAIGISFQTFTADGANVHGTVPNAQSTFSFLDEVLVTRKAKYSVCTDIVGNMEISSKTVLLNEGDNVFYIFEYAGDNLIGRYTVTIRRKPMYTVTFQSNGGTAVEPQVIEEGGLVTVPDEPLQPGYDFIGWNFDFATPITSSVTLKA